jgi:hypothetical protein
MSRLAIIGTLAASLLIAACSGSAEKPDKSMDPAQMGPNLSGPRSGVYLRASFDDDPSHFIGRFISNDVAADEVDENRGVQSACTEYVTYKEVRASGTFDEYYNASTAVQGGFGISAPGAGGAAGAALNAAGADAPSGSADGSFSSGTAVRVKYELTKKLVANIEDIAGFNKCCASNPGACSNRFIGEFWKGTGELYENTGQQMGANAEASAPQGEANLSVADGWVWRRATNFDDVYFAFRVMDRQTKDTCAWADQVPVSDKGQYFVGVSPPSATEDIARQMAMRNARTQAVQYLGSVIRESSTSTSNVVQGYVENANVIETAAEGIASFVKDERYCAAETIETPEGVKFKTKVLAFFPEEKKAEAAAKTVDAVENQMEAEGKLDEKTRKELQDVRVKVGN